MSNFPDILKTEIIKERDPNFTKALFSLDKKNIDQTNFSNLIRIYTSTKELSIRNQILKLLYDFDFSALKDFFNLAYKKERYLDMKINALRGLAKFVSEQEIEKLLQKFNVTLKKRQENTPYNYQEYELLRGKHALPYLVKKYNYSCLKETLDQVNKQYEVMPEAFKGIFTTDENGEIVSLKKPEEASKSISDFFESNKK